MPIVNPGTEGRDGTTEANAAVVAASIALLLRASVDREPSEDQLGGYYGFCFSRDGKTAQVLIPGDDPVEVCEGRPMKSRRLYVEGSSWLYGFALNAIKRHLEVE